MANIVDLESVRNRSVAREPFDLSMRNCFTAKVGELLPITCDEVIPKDKWTVKLRQFMRTAPIQTASYGRLRQYYDFYFVPYRLLWDKYPAWVVQTGNPYHARTVNDPALLGTQHPYFTNKTVQAYIEKIAGESFIMDNGNGRQYGTLKLLSYLGYGSKSGFWTTSDEIALNPFPLLCYQKIYQDWFRYSKWEQASPWTYNLDYIMTTDVEIKVETISPSAQLVDPTMFDLHACSFDKDYFTGMIPSANGYDGLSAIATPIYGNFSGPATAVFPAGPSGDGKVFVGGTSDGNPGVFNLSDGSGTLRPLSIPLEQLNFRLDNNNQIGLDYLSIRYAQAVQKWMEITRSGDPDYRDQIRKHWDLDVGNDMSYRCQYLGGISADVDISGIDNTNLYENEAVIRGKGMCSSNGEMEFTSKDYGIIMCVYHCKALHDYNASGFIPRLNLKTKVTDYAIPEFDRLGYQAVMRGETISSGVLTTPLGYVPRYAEYKTAVDVCHGAFEESLKPWTLPYDFAAVKNRPIDYLRFKIPYNFCDNMFGVQADDKLDTDQLYCVAYFDRRVIRALDRDGLPY